MGGQGEVGRRERAAVLKLSTWGQLRGRASSPVSSPLGLSPGLWLAQCFWKLEAHALAPVPTSTPYLLYLTTTGRSSWLNWLQGCRAPFPGEAELLQSSSAQLSPAPALLCAEPRLY